ncbi:hypothetical protein Droror1_Dr00022518 [Drosera rotundifolia]
MRTPSNQNEDYKFKTAWTPTFDSLGLLQLMSVQRQDRQYEANPTTSQIDSSEEDKANSSGYSEDDIFLRICVAEKHGNDFREASCPFQKLIRRAAPGLGDSVLDRGPFTKRRIVLGLLGSWAAIRETQGRQRWTYWVPNGPAGSGPRKKLYERFMGWTLMFGPSLSQGFGSVLF